MWLSQNTVAHSEKKELHIGTVTGVTDTIVVSCAQEYMGVRLSGPAGIPYQPRVSDQVLLADTDDGPVIVGVLFDSNQQAQSIQLGYAQGSALTLHQDGTIKMGSLTVQADGTLQSGEQRWALANKNGAQIILGGDGSICLGPLTVQADAGLKTVQQQLALEAGSGARIVLEQDGTILLNDVRIGTDGTVTAAAYLRE